MPKIKSIRVGFGVSVAKGPGNWLKSSAEMEIDFEEGDDAQKDAIWENAWDRVTAECGNQLKRMDAEDSELTR